MNDISVLVVDDEISVLKAISSVLSREQMQVTSANNSIDALNYIKNQSFDLILLDIIMPDLDGFSLLKEIRNQHIITPIILLSGRDEDTAQVKGLSLGADDYMIKPFSKTVLVSKIRAIIRRTKQYTLPASSIQTIAQRGCFTLYLDSQREAMNLVVSIIKQKRDFLIFQRIRTFMLFYGKSGNPLNQT